MWICPKCGREFKRRNQSHYCGEPPKTVEDYILQQEEEVQSYLWLLHQTILRALPDAKERIAWSMPSYDLKEPIVQFSAFKNHVSLYAGADAIQYFEEKLQGYVCKKSAIYLNYDQPLPEGLITEIVKWCADSGREPAGAESAL